MKSGYLTGWFKGIKGRLLMAAFLPVIGFGILFGISMTGLEKTHVFLQTANETVIPNLIYLSNMRQARNKFGYKALELEFLVKEDDSARRKEVLKVLNESIEEWVGSYEKYKSANFIEGEDAIHDKVKDKVIPEYIKTLRKIAELLSSGDPARSKEALIVLESDFPKYGNQIGEFNGAVVNLYEKKAEEESKLAEENHQQVFYQIVFVAIMCSAVIFGLLLWIAAKISNSVVAIADRLSGASSQVTTAVEQLNEAGSSLSQSSTEAAASLEETVASLEELTSMVQMNSDNAKQAASLSISSRESAEAGENEIKKLITSMTDISASSKKIEEIISVIDDIAFQTNLLALNAAVEAARAGEQGKGFAVVAEAVRALAQRSAASAKDISSLIKDSVEQVEHGGEIADKSGAVLANIVNSIKKVSDLNNEIASASAEQTAGIQQISKAMNQLDQASQTNAASAEEIAATSGEISNLAVTAQDLTVDLQRVILGGKTENRFPA